LIWHLPRGSTGVFAAGIIIGGVLPLPAAPLGVVIVGVVDGVGMVLGVVLGAGVVPVMAAGVLPVIEVGVVVGSAVLPAAPVEGAGVVPVVGGGVVGGIPTAAGVVPSPQPVSAAMTQSVERVANLVVMESSKFELTHISPEASVPLRTCRQALTQAPIRVCLALSRMTPARFGHSYTLLYQ